MATATATAAAAAKPIRVRNGICATTSPQSAMTTVAPAKITALPAVATRAGDGLLDLHALAELAAVPGGEEQRVVDADREADHHRQRRGGGVDRGEERGDQQDAGHRDADPEDRGEQRHAGGDEASRASAPARASATTSPTASVAETGVEVVVNIWPPRSTLDARALGRPVAASSIASVSSGVDLLQRDVELDLDERVRPSSEIDRSRGSGRRVRRRTGRPRRRSIGCYPLSIVAAVRGDPLALGRGEHDLADGAGQLGEPGVEDVEPCLGLGAGDRQVVAQLTTGRPASAPTATSSSTQAAPRPGAACQRRRPSRKRYEDMFEYA